MGWVFALTVSIQCSGRGPAAWLLEPIDRLRQREAASSAARQPVAAAEIEGEIVTVEIGLQVDFGRETAARAAERLIVPPFAPAVSARPKAYKQDVGRGRARSSTSDGRRRLR